MCCSESLVIFVTILYSADLYAVLENCTAQNPRKRKKNTNFFLSQLLIFLAFHLTLWSQFQLFAASDSFVVWVFFSISILIFCCIFISLGKDFDFFLFVIYPYVYKKIFKWVVFSIFLLNDGFQLACLYILSSIVLY